MKTKISFEIQYNTRPGEDIFITGNISELGLSKIESAKKMEYSDGKWKLSILLKNSCPFTYSYFLKDEHGKIFPEAVSSRYFTNQHFQKVKVFDQWIPFTEETPFLSNAFRNVFFKSDNLTDLIIDELVITCSPNNLSEESILYLTGSSAILGKWDENSAIKMLKGKGGVWYALFKKKDFSPNTEYKFLIKNIKSGIYSWEEGLNRQFPDYLLENEYESIVVNNYKINLTAEKKRYAGTAIPVFSLRTQQGCGIGEFLDIIPFADFLNKTGQRVLQILPVNDTTMNNTWEDSYPYGAISIFALHPLYINLIEAGKINDDSYNESFAKESARLNMLEEIDYDSVAELKWDYLKRLFSQDGVKTLSTKRFITFFNNNKSWLEPYALFSYFRDKFGTADFSKWGSFSKFSIEILNSFTSKDCKTYNEIALYYFIQYHLDIQLKKAHDYINSKGIILKGDIPIGVNRNSVEAWCEPQYFNFNGQAGAPPDDFSVKGQNWGFPTYNWDNIENEGYEWWKRRFRKMAEYFDAYRIDHILGFFRIWEIPSNAVDGLLGYFNPSLPYSADEIRSLGYLFNYDRDCTPFIREYIIKEYFKNDYKIVSDIFMDNVGWEVLMFKKEFSSQRSIEQYFVENPKSEVIKYKDSLFSLITDVLFIQDPYDNNKYHPRISAQYTKSYSNLSQDAKDAFNRIYNQYFYHRNDGFWYGNAMKKLPSLISSTDMLVCGEDLGMIPSCVPSAMNSLSILSLEIERMPKNPELKFGKTLEYPYLSVCTTGTHDTSTLRGWWEEDRSISNEYFKTILNETGEAPYYCEPWICKKIINNHLTSNSMLAIIPLQDWLSLSSALRRENPHTERINIPANPKHYWKYRVHLNIEEISNDTQFITEISEIIKCSGR